MARKTKKPIQAEFLPAHESKWHVRAAMKLDAKKKPTGEIDPAGLHKLLFRRIVICKERGQAALKRFERLAELYNEKNTQPRPKIQCAADAINPEAELVKQTKRAAKIQAAKVAQ